MEQIQITNDCSTSKYQLKLFNYPTFTNANRLFVLSFQRIGGENNTTKDQRDSFSHHYVLNATIKDFNVLMMEKVFLTCQ